MAISDDIERYGIDKNAEGEKFKRFVIDDLLSDVSKKFRTLFVRDDLLSVSLDNFFTNEELSLMLEQGLEEDELIEKEIVFEQEKIRNSVYLRFALEKLDIPEKINYEKSFLMNLLLRLSLHDARICGEFSRYIGKNKEFCSFNTEFIGGEDGYFLLLIYAVLKNGELDVEYFGKVLNDNFKDYSYGAYVNALQRLEDIK